MKTLGECRVCGRAEYVLARPSGKTWRGWQCTGCGALATDDAGKILSPDGLEADGFRRPDVQVATGLTDRDLGLLKVLGISAKGL